MRLPRPAVLVRIAIYGPLLAYFGYRAYERWDTARRAEAAAEAHRREVERVLEEKTRAIPLPDGTVKHVPVLTAEEAERLWGIEVPKASPPAVEETGGGRAASGGDVPLR